MNFMVLDSFKPFLPSYFSSLSSKTYQMIDKRFIVRGNKLIGLSIVLMGLAMSLNSCEKEPLSQPYAENSIPPTSDEGFLYCSDYTGNFELWKFENDEHTQLTSNKEWDSWWPKMSPMGDQILFYRSKSGRDVNDFDNASLHLMNSDGSGEIEILAQDANGWIMQGLANWSSDGTQIIMAAVDPEIGTWQLYISDNEGKQVERISTRDEANYLDPIFDRDDQAIFCSVTPEGLSGEENHEIFKIELTTGEEIRLTNNSVSDHHPAVSPDGKYLAYETLNDPTYLSLGKWSLKELNLRTYSEKTILEDDQINLFPVYDVAGENIYYTRLNVETFLMTGARFNRGDETTTLLVPTDRNSFNLDPYSF